MSTRVVERDEAECRKRIRRTLAAAGYEVRETEAGLSGRYSGRKRPVTLWRPGAEVRAESVSDGATKVCLDFPANWFRAGALKLGYVALGFVPATALLAYAAYVAMPPVQAYLIGTALSLAWAVFVVVFLGMQRERKAEEHCRDAERTVWDELDPDGNLSHEISYPWKSSVRFWRAVKCVALFVALAGGLLLVASICLPPWSDALDAGRGEESVLVHMVLFSVLGPNGAFAGAILLLGGLAVFVATGWLVCSYGLAHRHHWKAHFAAACLLSCAVVAAPVMLLAWRAIAGVVPGRYAHLEGVGQCVCTSAILLVQALGVLHLFRFFSHRPGADVYSFPSAKYEELSAPGGGNADRLAKRYRCWTFALVAVYGALCWAATAVLVWTAAESGSALAGSSGAMRNSGAWPMLWPLEGKAGAAQALGLALLFALPAGAAWFQSGRMLRRKRKAAKLARRLEADPEGPDLPDGPFRAMRRELGVERVPVALLPSPFLDVRLDRYGCFRPAYFVHVSAGARRTLSPEELEAMLWHECEHAPLLRSGGHRDLLSVMIPWSPRLLDLAEDLYDHERRADAFAVQAMGTAGPLRSALDKVKQERESFGTRARSRERRGRFSRETVRAVWSPGWAGYLHPDLDQRIAWVEDTLQEGVEMGRNESVLTLAEKAARAVVDDLFPQHVEAFPEAWSALVSLFEEWNAAFRTGKRPAGVDLSGAAGLGFAQPAGRDFAAAVMTTVSTCLDMWYGGYRDHNGAVETAKQWARSFGAVPGLEAILVERVPRFCLDVLNEMDAKVPEDGEPWANTTSEYVTIIRSDKKRIRGLEEDIQEELEETRKRRDEFDLFLDDLNNDFFVNGVPFEMESSLERRFLVLLFHRVGAYWNNEHLFKKIWGEEGKTGNDFYQLQQRIDKKLGGILKPYVKRPRGTERCYVKSAMADEVKYALVFRPDDYQL